MRTVPPPIPSKFFQGIPKVFVVLLIAIPVILLTLVVSFTVWRWRLHREINARIDRIQKAGLPVDWKGLNIWPSLVPDNENAAWIYTNAIAHLQPKARTNAFQFQLPRRKGAVSAEDRALIAGAVQSNLAALEIVYSVSNFSKSRYAVNYLDGPGMKLPHLAPLKNIAKLLEYQALLEADAGNASGAAKAVKASVDIAHSLEGEPEDLSQVVAAGILRISADNLQRVLSRIQLSDDALATLQQSLV